MSRVYRTLGRKFSKKEIRSDEPGASETDGSGLSEVNILFTIYGSYVTSHVCNKVCGLLNVFY